MGLRPEAAAELHRPLSTIQREREDNYETRGQGRRHLRCCIRHGSRHGAHVREGAKVVIADVLEHEARRVADAIGASARFAVSKTSPTPDARSGGCDGLSPLVRRLGAEYPQRRAGDEMALEVEGVVDGGVHAEKTLGGASRLEPLHFALSAAAPPDASFRLDCSSSSPARAGRSVADAGTRRRRSAVCR